MLDAAGGVRALAAATDALVARMVDWIAARGDHEAATNPSGCTPRSN